MPVRKKTQPAGGPKWGRALKPCYLLGLTALLAAKYLYSKAGAVQLRWILAPTAWWVRLLGRIPFGWEPHLGYVSHPFRFILAPSCSGVQFMLIAAATLFFSFIHRMETKKEKLGWTLSSLMISYLFTISVNSLRIILSIYLPLLLKESGILPGRLTSKGLHTAIGVLVYFPSLLLLYQTACRSIDARHPRTTAGPIPETAAPKASPFSLAGLSRQYLPPVFWYFFIVLGLPFFHQAYQTDGKAFAAYALLIAVLCLFVLLLFGMVLCVQRCYLPPKPSSARQGTHHRS